MGANSEWQLCHRYNEGRYLGLNVGGHGFTFVGWSHDCARRCLCSSINYTIAAEEILSVYIQAVLRFYWFLGSITSVHCSLHRGCPTSDRWRAALYLGYLLVSRIIKTVSSFFRFTDAVFLPTNAINNWDLKVYKHLFKLSFASLTLEVVGLQQYYMLLRGQTNFIVL